MAEAGWDVIISEKDENGKAGREEKHFVPATKGELLTPIRKLPSASDTDKGPRVTPVAPPGPPAHDAYVVEWEGEWYRGKGGED